MVEQHLICKKEVAHFLLRCGRFTVASRLLSEVLVQRQHQREQAYAAMLEHISSSPSALGAGARGGGGGGGAASVSGGRRLGSADEDAYAAAAKNACVRAEQAVAGVLYVLCNMCVAFVLCNMCVAFMLCNMCEARVSCVPFVYRLCTVCVVLCDLCYSCRLMRCVVFV